MKTQLHGNFDFQDQKVEHSQLPISSEASSAKAEVSQTQIKESEPPPTIISLEDFPARAKVSQTQLTESDPLVTYTHYSRNKNANPAAENSATAESTFTSSGVTGSSSVLATLERRMGDIIPILLKVLVGVCKCTHWAFIVVLVVLSGVAVRGLASENTALVTIAVNGLLDVLDKLHFYSLLVVPIVIVVMVVVVVAVVGKNTVKRNGKDNN